jgi:hypothetical protein
MSGYCKPCENEVEVVNGECAVCGQPVKEGGMSKEKTFAFWVELEGGQEIRWSCLTKHQAVSMYNRTDERSPMNVKKYGWEEMRWGVE